MAELKETARKHALKNAFDYGKANAGAVAGKVLAELPEAKQDMKSAMQVISLEVAQVNKLDKVQVEQQMAAFSYVEKKETKKKLVLPNAGKGNLVVVRFPPEPNGYPHIGHAKAFFLEWQASRDYNGKVILRWDDTNPEAEKEEFVNAIRSGLKWLGLDWDEEVYCSDWIPKMYELNEKLLKQGDAYICNCTREKIAGNREKKKRCNCANALPIEQVKLWKGLLGGKVKRGQAVVRLKGDMASLNTVMRDPTLWRIIEARHYRQGSKYSVWPTYDFQGPVMDSLLGVTHPLRSKEYELRDELYIYLLSKLKLRIPSLVTISRLSIKGMPVSKRLIKPLVESGKLWGWDDPRLPTLAGLKRRGILPEAIKNFVLGFGLSKVESNPLIDALLSENRKLLDVIAPHYFFVANPLKLEISGSAPDVASKAEAAGRNFPVENTSEVFVPGNDIKALKKGDVFRLKDFAGVKLTSVGKELKGEFTASKRAEGEKIVQWVFSRNALEAKLSIPRDLLKENGDFNEKSIEELTGFCPASVAEIKVGEVVQFERVGFARLDSLQGQKPAFIFSC